MMTNDFDFSSLPVSTLTGKPVLHFAHANGMPSKVYQPLFDVWSDYFTIEYIEKFGATDGYVIDDHWQNLTQQIIDSVTETCQRHQVPNLIAVGHSLGALCSLQAIYRCPQWFSQAVILDPPLIYGKHSLLWHVGKQLDKLPFMNHRILDKLSPSGISKHRRDIWDSRDEARKSFADKKFFANFDPRCFEGYIQYGLSETDEGKVTLTIPKNNEVAVFRTNPSWYWLTPNRPPQRPVVLIVSNDSQFLRSRFPQQIQSRLRIPYQNHNGGHMFPLEYPDSVSMKILHIIDEQLKRKVV